MKTALVALSLLLTPALALANGQIKKTYPTALSAAKAGGAYAISRATSTPTRASDVAATLLRSSSKSETFRINDGDNNRLNQTVIKLKAGDWKAFKTTNVTIGQ